MLPAVSETRAGSSVIVLALFLDHKMAATAPVIITLIKILKKETEQRGANKRGTKRINGPPLLGKLKAFLEPRLAGKKRLGKTESLPRDCVCHTWTDECKKIQVMVRLA